MFKNELEKTRKPCSMHLLAINKRTLCAYTFSHNYNFKLSGNLICKDVKLEL